MTNEEFQLRLKQAEDLSEIKAIVTRMDHACLGMGNLELSRSTTRESGS